MKRPEICKEGLGNDQVTKKRFIHIDESTLCSTDTVTEYSKHLKHVCAPSCPCIFQDRIPEHRPPGSGCFVYFRISYKSGCSGSLGIILDN